MSIHRANFGLIQINCPKCEPWLALSAPPHLAVCWQMWELAVGYSLIQVWMAKWINSPVQLPLRVYVHLNIALDSRFVFTMWSNYLYENSPCKWKCTLALTGSGIIRKVGGTNYYTFLQPIFWTINKRNYINYNSFYNSIQLLSFFNTNTL